MYVMIKKLSNEIQNCIPRVPYLISSKILEISNSYLFLVDEGRMDKFGKSFLIFKLSHVWTTTSKKIT